ncbi:MAG TPA: class I adenylate-forming enzyme family protein [Ilumatobacteraceae bacterium]|jgi:long-chain acyl-CoA synthetase|nr:class I adenylate-forming enzyme family protein [Ilumatobacteraceae bacterium]
MTLSWEEACAQISAPGSPFEIVEDEHGRRRFKHAPPNMRTLFAVAREGGDDIFIVYEDERLSFNEVFEQVDALADALVHRYEINKGDRVAIGMRNYPEWVMSTIAIMSVGAVSVALNALWVEDELDYALDDCGAKVLIADVERIGRALAPCRRLGVRMIEVRAESPSADDVDQWKVVVVPGPAMPAVDVDWDDDATILYTSGTTGRPKGAVSTNGAIVSSAMAFGSRAAADAVRAAAALPPGESPPAAPTPVFILIVPLFHVTGSVPVMLSCVVLKSKLVVMYRWNAEKALELIERERVTNFVGVPTQSWDLVNSPRFSEFDTSSLRGVGGGGAPAPTALVERVAGSVKSGGPTLGYGMTETNAYGPNNTGADYISHPTSTGRAMPIMRIEIRDPQGNKVPNGERGEIWFDGPTLIRGYWNKPEATAETIVDGWLRSGDIGRVDDEGFVYVEDRLKDMILRGGENVYCAEVESAIYAHPDIHEAAVFGIPDERLGEEVAVAIHLVEGATLTADELRAFLSKKIAAFMIPSRIVFVDEPLPRNPAGKFLKREMRQGLVS